MQIEARLQQIRLLVLDVDGVLTEGKLYFGEQGEQLKTFNILDGLGIKMLQQSGVDVAIITGRVHPAVAQRASNLGIQHVLSGREDKNIAIQELWQQLPWQPSQTAVMGDDWPDLLAMRDAEFAATVPNAAEAVLEYADWCATRRGGEGAVREFCELIMKAQGTYQQALNAYLHPASPEA